jgi:hypothetical protein
MRRLIFFLIIAGIPLVEAQAQIPADTLVTGQSQPALAQATPGGPWLLRRPWVVDASD